MKSRVFNADADPDTVPRTRREMALASVHLTMLEEVLGYMQEALEHVHIPPEPPGNNKGVALVLIYFV